MSEQIENGQKETGSKKKIFIILLAAIIILGGGILAYVQIHNKKVHQVMALDTIYPGVTVDGVEVGGMSEAEAVSALSDIYSTKVLDESIDLTHGEDSWKMTFADIGAGYQVAEAVESAYLLGREGTEKEKFQTVSSLLKKGIEVPLEYTYDEELFMAKLSEIATDFDREAEDSSMSRKNGAFVIIPEKEGRVMNKAKTAEAVKAVIETRLGGKAAITAETTEPQITYEDNQMVTDLIGSYTTKYTLNDRNRNTNLEVGCGYLNGQLIAPGEVFSATEGLGSQTYDRGYRNAGVYVNGKVEDGMGGGVCQITTTLYNAAIFAELEIAERHPHSMTVGYVPLGRDAAIADHYKDLRIKNNTAYPIYIDTYAANGTLAVNLYGHEVHEAGRKVEFETAFDASIPKPEEIVKEDAEKPEGEREVTHKGRTGSKVTVYKKVTENGKTTKDWFSSSSYRAVADEVTVGTKKEETEDVTEVVIVPQEPPFVAEMSEEE